MPINNVIGFLKEILFKIGGGLTIAEPLSTVQLLDKINQNISNVPSQGTGLSGGRVIVGGTGAADGLELRATSGAGTTSQVTITGGNNGATTLAKFTADNQVLINDGSLAAPGIAFINDTNTGFIRVADDTFGFSTGGVMPVRIRSTGIEFIAWDNTNGNEDHIIRAAMFDAASATVVRIANIYPLTNATASLLQIYSDNLSTLVINVLASGNIQISGVAAKSITVNRHATSNTAGNNLTVGAGGATSGATDKNGGTLNLDSGVSTGTGESGIKLRTYPAGATGTSDNTQATMLEVLGNKWALSGNTPTVTESGWTGGTFTEDKAFTGTAAALSETNNVLASLIDELVTKGVLDP